MNITLYPSNIGGTIKAVASKSEAHRALICAAFSQNPCKILCECTNEDIDATARCLCALGAKITYNQPFFCVTPIDTPADGARLLCGESGSTLRFLLPIISAMGINASFEMAGRLPTRPLSPLYGELVRHGAILSPEGSNPLTSGGKLCKGNYKIRGDVSSQFISGLLFALTFSGNGGEIIIEGKTESAPYIQMTLDTLALFGANIVKTDKGYYVPENIELNSPDTLEVGGDWSNSAFPLCMGALGKAVTVNGLYISSSQGDKKIVEVLRKFGADIAEQNGSYTSSSQKRLTGIELDASQIPDLVPVISVVAAAAEGTTRIFGASRLKLKESDRLQSTSAMLTSLGASVTVLDDGLLIEGTKSLKGGKVDCAGDHRIAMSAAVASLLCENPVELIGAECVAKSYPAFWQDMKNCLGLIIKP